MNTSEQNVWQELFTQPEMFTIESTFRKEITDFFSNAEKIQSNLPAVRGIVSEIIYKNVENQLFPYLIAKNLLPIKAGSKDLKVLKGHDSCGITVSLEKPYMGFIAPLINCALLKRNPFQFLEEKYHMFSVEQIYFSIRISYLKSPTPGRTEITAKLSSAQLSPYFTHFWDDIVTEIHANEDIQTFNTMLTELHPIAKEISQRVKKHIDQYVTTEKM